MELFRTLHYYYTNYPHLFFLISIFVLFSLSIVLVNNSIDSDIVYGVNVTITKMNLSPEETQLILLNLKRINSQTDSVAQSLKDNNTEGAFYHAYISHSVTYPTIKQVLDKVDKSTSIKLKGLLTDLPIIINSKSKTSPHFLRPLLQLI